MKSPQKIILVSRTRICAGNLVDYLIIISWASATSVYPAAAYNTKMFVLKHCDSNILNYQGKPPGFHFSSIDI